AISAALATRVRSKASICSLIVATSAFLLVGMRRHHGDAFGCLTAAGQQRVARIPARATALSCARLMPRAGETQLRISGTAPDLGVGGSSLTAPFLSDSAIMRTTSALIGSIDLMDVMTASGSAGTETVLSS